MEPIMEKKSAATATTTTTPPTTPRRRLCIGAEDGRGRAREWYTVDITEDDDREIVRCSCNCGCASCAKRMRHDTRGSPSLLPIAILKVGKNCRDAYNWAVLGDQLYFLALKKRRFSEFGPIMPTLLAFDLTDPSAPNQWMHKPDMLAPRSDSPSMVVVGGKLYALGGLDEDHYHCWAAVYDPTSDTWEDLPDPPFLPERGFYAASLEAEGGDSIIVLSVRDGVLMEYDVVYKFWNVYESELGDSWLPNWSSEGHAVAVGRVLYWFCARGNCLYGLDLDTHVLYTSEALVDLESQEPMLGHLGGNRFFLLYENLDTRYDGIHKTTFLHCWKFSVSVGGASSTPTSTAGEEQRTAKIEISQESSQSFAIKDGLLFTGCVLF